MVGATGAASAIAKNLEATDNALPKTEGDGATGAASSLLVFLDDQLLNSLLHQVSKTTNVKDGSSTGSPACDGGLISTIGNRPLA